MKKILSLVLAIMMVLSMTTAAFAAPSDVTDKNQIKAIDALTSLGIVKGYEDGSYKPEQVVTRAEMAKMLVTALGQGNLADGSESSFKDSKGKWYDGFVAMAAGLELVNGYPDGTFKGENPVSYQEAVVMTLRALGYTNAMVNNGVNAYNDTKYKALGASLGLLKNITFKAGGASRGDVASMVYNSLEIHRVMANEKGLAEKIQIDKQLIPVAGSNPVVYREVPVYETLLDKLTTRKDVNVTPDSLDSKNKAYLGNIVDLEPYMYQTIVAYLNSNGHVMFVKSSKTTTVKGTVTPVKSTDFSFEANKNNVLITKEDKTKEWVKFNTNQANPTIKVYLNGGQRLGFDLSDFQYGGSLHGAKVTLVLDSNDVIVAAVAKMADLSVKITNPYKAGSSNLGSIKLPKTTSNKVDLTNVKVTGEVTSIEDIVEKDIVTVYYAAGNKSNPAKVELVVCRDVVEGKITGTKSGAFVINEDLYYENDSDVTALSVGSEGKFYLNSDGDIVAFEGKSISNANYALITSLKQGSVVSNVLIKDAYIKLMDKDGKSTTLNFASSAQYVLTDENGNKEKAKPLYLEKDLQKFDSIFKGFSDETTNFNNKYIVTGYNLNDNGQISLISVQKLIEATVNPASKVFDPAKNIVIFSMYDSTKAPTATNKIADTFKVSKVEDLKKEPVKYYSLINDNGQLELVIADERLVDDSSFGIIIANDVALNSSNEPVRKVTAYVKGEKIEYLTTKEVEVGKVADLTGDLFSLELENGVVTADLTTGTAIKANEITKVTGKEKSDSKNAVIYVYEQSSTVAYTFSRVGDLNDLGESNATFKFYDLDGQTGYEVVIVKIKR
jgi:hypothetical protein